MTSEEMHILISEFQTFVYRSGKISPVYYPVLEQILSTFYMWYADKKLQES
jgi:hypothetical protein